MMNNLSTGSTRKRISKINFGNAVIRIPSYSEQQRIADYLSTLGS